MTEEPLAPCPFCGSDRIRITAAASFAWFGTCLACRAQGPEALCVDDATIGWNARPLSHGNALVIEAE